MAESLVDGLKNAMERGETLQKAMTTFYNAGYTREEVESSARLVNQSNINPANILNQGTAPAASAQAPSAKPILMARGRQSISSYGVPVKKKMNLPRGPVLILVVLLLVLLGSLLGIFLFREQLVDFFNRILS